jgi:hypothetical protein
VLFRSLARKQPQLSNEDVESDLENGKTLGMMNLPISDKTLAEGLFAPEESPRD